MRKNSNGGLVYSTERGRTCPGCGMGVGQCSCAKVRIAGLPRGEVGVRIARETKGRKGAGVTLIRGLPLATDQLKVLAAQLKQKCGSGGTVKEGVIEIQGDHRQFLLGELTRQGFQVKLAGG